MSSKGERKKEVLPRICSRKTVVSETSVTRACSGSSGNCTVTGFVKSAIVFDSRDLVEEE